MYSLTIFSADMNPETMRQIDRRLDNILRESSFLPQQNKERILSEIKSIRKILAEEMYDNRDEPIERYRHENTGRRGVRLYENSSFQDLKVRLKSAWPYRDQLVFIRRLNRTSAFTVRQILELAKVIDFPNDQKEVALILLPNALDLENVDILYELFWSISDREKINRIADESLR